MSGTVRSIPAWALPFAIAFIFGFGAFLGTAVVMGAAAGPDGEDPVPHSKGPGAAGLVVLFLATAAGFAVPAVTLMAGYVAGFVAVGHRGRRLAVAFLGGGAAGAFGMAIRYLHASPARAELVGYAFWALLLVVPSLAAWPNARRPPD